MSDETETRQTEADEVRGPSPEERRDELRRELGRRLRAARERKKLSIEEASTRLRIRRDYLEALEDADWDRLPEEVYALGFLRQYARFLDEDVADAVAELKSGDYRLTKPFTMPDPPIAPNRTWAIAAGLAFVLLLILFNTLGGDEQPAPPADIAPPAGESAAPPSEAGPAAPEPGPETPPPAAPATAAAPPSPTTNAASPAPATVASGPTPEAASSTPTPEPTPTRVTHRYRLMAATDKAWLQVRDASGRLLREALLQPGQSVRLASDAPYLTVTCGNAAALAIEVDGETFAAAGTLGAPGKVLRDFRIAPPTTAPEHPSQPMVAPALPR